MFSWRTHPDGEHLLRFCEGELTSRENSRISRHVEGCWECRTAIDDVRNLINEYVHYRRDVLRPSLPPPPGPWIDLESQLRRRRLTEITNRPRGSFFRRPTSWLLFGAATLFATTPLWWQRVTLFTGKPVHRIEEPKAATEFRSAAPSTVIRSAQSATTSRSTDETPKEPFATPEDELNVVAALHRIGADLGDPIEVVRSAHEITVTGAGLEPNRVEQLQKVLAGMPRVSLRLAEPPKPAEADSPAVDVQSGRSPLETNVSQQFPTTAAFEKFVDDTLQASEEMMARAHALRRLSDRFPPAVEDQLQRGAIDLLASIRKDLASNLVEDASTIDRTLTPVLRSLGEKVPARQPANISDWQSLSSTLFTSADRADTLIGALLATTADSKSDSTPARLAGALGQLKADSMACRRFVGTRQRDGK